MNVLNYNIHNLIEFQVVRDKGMDRFKDLNLPYSYFEVEKIKNPDIILNIGAFNPSNENCYLVDHKYYIRDNYFYCKDSGGTAHWEVEIKGFEKGKTIINYNGKINGPESWIYPDLLMQDIFLRSIIDYKLKKKGFFLIHSAGVSKNNKGYLFTGRGSSYKTSLAMDLVRKFNYSFLGDDKVILGKNLKLFSFPVHLKAFEYKSCNLRDENFRNSSGNISIKSIQKYCQFMKNLKNNKDYNNNKLPIIDSSCLKSLFFVNRTNYMNKVQKEEKNNKAKKMCLNSLSEIIKGHTFMFFDYGQYFYKYLLAYSFIFPDNLLKKHWHNSNENLNEILDKVSLYGIYINNRYDKNILNDLKDFIEY